MGEGTDSLRPTENPAGDVVLHGGFSVCGRKKNTKFISKKHILSSDPQYHDKDRVRTRWLLAIL